MIAFLEGQLVEKQPTHVVMSVGGVGYEVIIPLSSFDRLPATGQSCRILTCEHLREDCHQLYGFMTEPERSMFVLLMTVSGIGPRLAVRALSGLSARELRAAIVGGDAKRLASISGIGKKIAERIVMELRDKIGPGEALEAVAGAREASAEDLKLRDAVMALIALGYKQAEARQMAAGAMKGGDSAGLSVEALVRRSLGGRRA
ncbi:MAG: Holliday junction branch migration protein RuvA [Verrucomicrobiota bacterium]|nr:Holliday junction branch migration protein RuvA [Verrucomicrobiota bacterium]